MRYARVWQRLLGIERAVIEQVFFDDEADCMVVSVRPRKGAAKRRCGICARRCGRYDRGEGRRRWRALDLGVVKAFVEADAPRVNCPEHGPTVVQVPWARHGAGHTRSFDDQVAWLVTHTSKSAVSELMRVAWRTVGAIVYRVVADAQALNDPFDGLTRIGIDEISYRRGHKYLTVVVDHDSGRLVWAAPGRDKATLEKFFVSLGKERSGLIKLVSADAAEWIATVVKERCVNATLCADPFHMVAWATKALDDERKALWRNAKIMETPSVITRIKGCRYALLKNPENLTDAQAASLARVAKINMKLYRAYLLKEQFRHIFQLRGKQAVPRTRRVVFMGTTMSDSGIRRALYYKIVKHRDTIINSLKHGLSNGLIESTNTKLRLITRMAYGFKSTDNLIALCMLDRGGYCPPLPGRQTA